MSVELDGRHWGRLDDPCQPSRKPTTMCADAKCREWRIQYTQVNRQLAEELSSLRTSDEQCRNFMLMINKFSLKFAQCRPRIQQMKDELDAAYRNLGNIEKVIDRLSDCEILEAYLFNDEIEPPEIEEDSPASTPEAVTTSKREPSQRLWLNKPLATIREEPDSVTSAVNCYDKESPSARSQSRTASRPLSSTTGLTTAGLTTATMSTTAATMSTTAATMSTTATGGSGPTRQGTSTRTTTTPTTFVSAAAAAAPATPSAATTPNTKSVKATADKKLLNSNNVGRGSQASSSALNAQTQKVTRKTIKESVGLNRLNSQLGVPQQTADLMRKNGFHPKNSGKAVTDQEPETGLSSAATNSDALAPTRHKTTAATAAASAVSKSIDKNPPNSLSANIENNQPAVNTQLTKNTTQNTAENSRKPIPPPVNKSSIPTRAKNATSVSSQATAVRPSQAEPRGLGNKLDVPTEAGGEAQYHDPLLPVKIEPRCDGQDTVADSRPEATMAISQTHCSTFKEQQHELSEFSIQYAREGRSFTCKQFKFSDPELHLTSTPNYIDTPISRQRRQRRRAHVLEPPGQNRSTRSFLSSLDAESQREQHFGEEPRAQTLYDENKATDQSVGKRGDVAEDTTNPKMEDVPTHHPANGKGKATVTRSRAALKESNSPDSVSLSASDHQEQRSTRLKRSAATKVVSYTERSLVNRKHSR